MVAMTIRTEERIVFGRSNIGILSSNQAKYDCMASFCLLFLMQTKA
jgi:hypothetical protein